MAAKELGVIMSVHMRKDETREEYLARRRAYYQAHKKEYHEYYEDNKDKWKENGKE